MSDTPTTDDESRIDHTIAAQLAHSWAARQQALTKARHIRQALDRAGYTVTARAQDGPTAPTEPPPDARAAQDSHRLAQTPSAPCPRWSAEEPHPAHDWDAPVDGPSRCPGVRDDEADAKDAEIDRLRADLGIEQHTAKQLAKLYHHHKQRAEAAERELADLRRTYGHLTEQHQQIGDQP